MPNKLRDIFFADSTFKLPPISADMLNAYTKHGDIISPSTRGIVFTAEIPIHAFKRLIGIDLAPARDVTLEFKEPYRVQVRRHKKRRINKKWAKKYGYKTYFRKQKLIAAEFHKTDEPNVLGFDVRGLITQ